MSSIVKVMRCRAGNMPGESSGGLHFTLDGELSTTGVNIDAASHTSAAGNAIRREYMSKCLNSIGGRGFCEIV